MGSSSGLGTQEAGAGSLLQALDWEEGVSQRCEARETGAQSPLRDTIALGKRVQVVQAR